MIDSLDPIQRALLCGAMFSIIAGLIGAFIVQRGLSFAGAGLSHSAFGGVALGLLLGVAQDTLAMPGITAAFTLLCALILVALQARTRIKSDVIVGVLFASSMALGTVFLSLRRTASGDAMSYLFGDILLLSSAEIYATGVMLLVTVAVAWYFWGRWAYAAFDEELARSQGVRVGLDDVVLLVMTALAVVLGIRIVGIFLLSAFLVIPASTARLASRTMRGMTVWAIAIALLSVFVGIFVSYQANIPSGAVIALMQTLLFIGFALMPRREG